MHSSRMRTGRSLTVFRSLQPGGGVPGPGGGVPGLGGCTWSWGGVPGPGGCTWSRGRVYLVLGGYLVPGGVYLVPGGVPGPGGVYLVFGGVPGPRGGVPGPGGCTWSRGGGVPGPRGGVPGPGGGVYLVRYSPPVNRMTNRCKNITLAKTSFRPVITHGFYRGSLVSSTITRLAICIIYKQSM